MPQVEINLVAALVAAIASIIIGFAWYSMRMFGKEWMKLAGLSPKDIEGQKKGKGSKYALMTLGALVMAYVLAAFVGILPTLIHSLKEPKLVAGLGWDS